jgi:hypothetical protein
MSQHRTAGEKLSGDCSGPALRLREGGCAHMQQDVPAGTRVTPVDVLDNISTALGISAPGLAVTLAPAYVAVMAALLGLTMKRVTGP